MPMDNFQSTDGVGLNPLGNSGGALIATDLVSINGLAASHVQYIKLGWGGDHDTYHTVGTDADSNGKPLPIMIRHTDGTAVNAANNKLDINLAGQGITLNAWMHNNAKTPAFGVQGTAGMVPVIIEGTAGARPVYIAATAGTLSANNGKNTIPSMLFGLSGSTAEPLGSTNGKLHVFHTDKININAGEGSPIFVMSTGGISAAGMAKGMRSHEAFPSLVLGNCGGTAAAIGMTYDGAGNALRVYQQGTQSVSFVLTGTGDAIAPNGTAKTMPSLIFGMSAGGPSAAALQVTGGRRLLTSLDGSRVAVDNFSDKGLFVRATGGFGVTAHPRATLPMMVFGLCGADAVPVGVTNGRLDVHMGSACLTVDVTVQPFLPILNATSDGSNAAASIHNRYLHVAGPTSNHTNFKYQELHPVFVSGKSDGSTYSYPIGITTAMVGASGGAWALQVTGETEIKKWSAGTLTVNATNFDIRGLTAKDGKDIVGVEGVSHGLPVLVKPAEGISGGSNVPIHGNLPVTLFGISSGGSAAAVGITGADILNVGIGHPVGLQAQGGAYPVFTQATGGLSASSGTNLKVALTQSNPSLIMGLSGTIAAPAGMSADAIKVYDIQGRSAGRDSIGVFAKGGVLGLCGAANNAVHNTLPVLMMGISAGGGNSAAPIGMSGDALNVNMVNAGITVDVTVGTSVEVSNDTGGPLYIAGASGASGSGALLPVSVAGNYQGTAVFVQGTGGMSPVEVRGFSAAGNDLGKFPIGVTSGKNWKMASDFELSHLGKTMDKMWRMLGNALGGGVFTEGDYTSENQFASFAQIDNMKPSGSPSTTTLPNSQRQNQIKTAVENISDAVISTPGQDQANGVQMQVDIIDILQPDGFTAGQRLMNGSAIQIQNETNTGKGFTLESGIKVKGHQNNTEFVYIGNSGVNSDTGFPLGPSEEIFMEISNLSKLYAIGDSGTKICYIGS